MNARWISRMLLGVRAGERHCALNHAALFAAPKLISLKSEWFLNEEQMPLRCAGIGVGENISPPLSWNGVPRRTAFSPAPKLKAILVGISGTVIGRGMLVGTYERP